jgi:hypothetical protein
MSSHTVTNPQEEPRIARHALERMIADLAVIVDRDVHLEEVHEERRRQRAVGYGQVHISFKLGIEVGDEVRQGCLLVPLPDAVSLAAYVMMLPDDVVAGERARTELDAPFKEALLEIGKFIAGACDSVLRRVLPDDCVTRSGGCQGVRAGVRPALCYVEGEELVVARARVRVHHFEPFEMILMLPALARAESLSAPARAA